MREELLEGGKAMFGLESDLSHQVRLAVGYTAGHSGALKQLYIEFGTGCKWNISNLDRCGRGQFLDCDFAQQPWILDIAARLCIAFVTTAYVAQEPGRASVTACEIDR